MGFRSQLLQPLLRLAVLTILVCASCREDVANATSSPSSVWFHDVTEEVGINFSHEDGAAGKRLIPEVMGGGVAFFDYDGDDDLDVYFTNGNRNLPSGRSSGQIGNRLFRQGKDGTFADVTLASKLGDTSYGMGVAVGDYDNDGDVDVYVSNLGGDKLYRNEGNGTFADVTEPAGIAVDEWSASVCFLDYDRDGFLDLFITQYLEWDASKKCESPDGRPDYCGPLSFSPIHDVLLHNDGDGTFSDASARAGITSVAAPGLGVACQDLNADGLPDIFVANDAYANHFWINEGDGTFRERAMAMGVAFNLHGTAEAGMGVVVADFNGDTRNDIFLSHLGQESNTYYRHLGQKDGYLDATGGSGLGWSSTPYTGFGVLAFDVELDGDLDVFAANGRIRRGEVLSGVRLASPWDSLAEPNLFYLNNGQGRFTFSPLLLAPFSRPIEISRGLAMGDLDSDGDLDFAVSNIHGPGRIMKNSAPRKGRYLVIRAVDPRLNRDAIGARVTVISGEKRFLRTVNRAVGYLSSSDSRVHFGLGHVDRIDEVTIDWPDGLSEKFELAGLDRFVTVVRGSGGSI